MRLVVAQERADPHGQARQAALSLGLTCEPVDCVCFADLPTRLAQGGADLALVVLGGEPRSALSALEQATSQRIPILAAGLATDPQCILQTMRSGARAFLDVDQLTSDLSSTLHQLRQAGSISENKQGLLIACCGALPGVGCTTVAINVAFALAEQHTEEVALVEAGGGVPGLALHLDLEPAHPIGSLAEHWQRIDQTLLAQVVMKHPYKVDVLCHRPELLAVPPLPRALQRTLLALLKATYGYAVADLGHDFVSETALGLADRVVVVTRLEIPTLRLTRRFLSRLESEGVTQEKLRVVVNRHGQPGQVPWKQAEEALGVGLVGEAVPDDPASFNAAANYGQPLVQAASRAKVTKAFAKLSSLLNGKPQ